MNDDAPSKFIKVLESKHNDQWGTSDEEQATETCERRIHCEGYAAIYKVWHAGQSRWVYHCPACADEPFPDPSAN